MLRAGSFRALAAVSAAAALFTSGGCANPQEETVEDTAQGFYRALDEDDGASACDRLSERTRSEVEKSAQAPCDRAILDEDIPKVRGAGQVNSFGVAAQVHFAGETTFLSRFRDGWHAVAAGCEQKPDGTYDCQVAAG